MTTFFTSDTHFFHENILDFCDRPFDSVEEMNEEIIRNWNQKVNKNDTVYHLGDVSFGKREETIEALRRLNGNIILCKGNHDSRGEIKAFLEAGVIKEAHEVGLYLKSHKQQMWLTHFPMDIGLRPNLWSISGHIHDTESRVSNQVNVGIDAPNYLVQSKPFGEPISEDELITYLKDKAKEVRIEKSILKIRDKEENKNSAINAISEKLSKGLMSKKKKEGK